MEIIQVLSVPNNIQHRLHKEFQISICPPLFSQSKQTYQHMSLKENCLQLRSPQTDTREGEWQTQTYTITAPNSTQLCIITVVECNLSLHMQIA